MGHLILSGLHFIKPQLHAGKTKANENWSLG